MKPYTRRAFLRRGALGLAAFGAGGLTLRAEAAPTQASGGRNEYAAMLKAEAKAGSKPAAPFAPTEKNILGPYHREGAPFRGKVTPPLEPGIVVLISGRVWGHDTRKPLRHAVIDVWQTNAKGHYGIDDPSNPEGKKGFRYRARLITDESGYYEFETVRPGRYKVGLTRWRPAHIHYMVQHPGYKTLVTQLYFKGDPMNEGDPFIKESLIIELEEHRVGEETYKSGVFDIVLAKV
jgi:protocatechuate 3,4-dioxygenase beta subunit